MAIHTFSTKEETQKEVLKLKLYCKKNYINFSAMVVQAITKQNKELENDKQR
jgi:hypothetical protein